MGRTAAKGTGNPRKKKGYSKRAERRSWLKSVLIMVIRRPPRRAARTLHPRNPRMAL
jgi:hypothetical protein